MSISAWFVGGVLGAKAGASAQWKEAATKYASVGRIFGAAFAGPYVCSALSVLFIFWEGLTGAALGKRLLRIRVKGASGVPAGYKVLFARAVIKYVSWIFTGLMFITGAKWLENVSLVTWIIMILGSLLVLRKNKLALHDLLAKTAVYPNKVGRGFVQLPAAAADGGGRGNDGDDGDGGGARAAVEMPEEPEGDGGCG